MNPTTEIGFEMYASHPPSRIRSSSPFMAKAVTAITGIAQSSVVFLEPTRDLEPGHLGQLDIHQDQMRVVLAGEIEHVHAVARLNVSYP